MPNFDDEFVRDLMQDNLTGRGLIYLHKCGPEVLGLGLSLGLRYLKQSIRQDNSKSIMHQSSLIDS